MPRRLDGPHDDDASSPSALPVAVSRYFQVWRAARGMYRATAMIRMTLRATSIALLLLAVARCTGTGDVAPVAPPDDDASIEGDDAANGPLDASKDSTKDAAKPGLDAGDAADATLPFCPAARPDECLTDAGAKVCVNQNADPENCGACGTKCGASQGCVAKQCKDKITLAAVAPKLVSGIDDCTMLASNAGHLVVLDAINTIYVGLRCKDSLHVIKSTDGGATFGAPVSTGIGPQTGAIDAENSSIAVADDGAIYAAGATTANSNNGTLVFTKSTDGGATWAQPSIVGSGTVTGFGAHLVANGSEVLIAAKLNGGGVIVYRNGARGVGTWTMSGNGLNGLFGDVFVDPATGHVWTGADNPMVALSKSTNGAATFPGTPTVVSGTNAYCSSYAIANGKIFVAGSNTNQSGGDADRLWVIDIASPTSASTAAGLPALVPTDSPSTRMIAADSTGKVYAVAQGSDGKVHIDRILAGTLAPADSIVVTDSGRYPNMAVTDDGFAVVAFSRRPMSTSSTYVTIHKY